MSTNRIPHDAIGLLKLLVGGLKDFKDFTRIEIDKKRNPEAYYGCAPSAYTYSTEVQKSVRQTFQETSSSFRLEKLRSNSVKLSSTPVQNDKKNPQEPLKSFNFISTLKELHKV